MNGARVFLIGGAPGSGKTTLGCALAARIGASSVTIDDLMTVAKTATTPETHPELYLFRDMSHVEYFTNSSFEQLRSDAERQSGAIWPFVKNLIVKHFRWTTTPVVIDGWHLRPHRVAELSSNEIDANWIYIAPTALERRERKNIEFLQGSSDPEKMFRNFLSRSLWCNDLVRDQAEAAGMTVIHQAGDTSVSDLCDAILAKSPKG